MRKASALLAGHRYRSGCVLGLALAMLGGAAGCRRAPPPPSEPEQTEEQPTPDRLTRSERLPETETAFGLPMPQGFRLLRHSNDSAYFGGSLGMLDTLEAIKDHLSSSTVELTSRRAVFSKAYIKGDARRRVVRVEISSTPRGSQIYIRDVTPPPATKAVSQEELWSRAGRKPDGTPLDENQLY